MPPDCDILVAGAGPAGVAAAVSAARRGARVLLVDRNLRPGGAGVTGMHPRMCGLHGEQATDPSDTLNGGLARQAALEITNRIPSPRLVALGRTRVLPCSPDVLASVFHAWLSAEPGIVQRFHHSVAAVEMADNRIAAIRVTDGGEMRTFRPRVAIDATGEGALIVMSDAPHEDVPPAARQLAGYTVRVRNVAMEEHALAIQVPLCLRRLVDRGEMPGHMRFTAFMPGTRPGEAYLKFSIPAALPDRNATAHRRAEEAHRALRRELPAFFNSWIDAESPCVLDREGVRLRGETVLTEEDVLAARVFGGGVRGAWPIEIWTEEAGPQYEYVPAGAWYEIPDGCLAARERPNLVCAGRCISVTRRALGSTRVMGVCIALGETAGRLAVERLA